MRSLLVSAAVLLTSLLPLSVSQAQGAHVDFRVGALSLADGGQRALRPRVALAVGMPVIGPIDASLRVSAIAEEFPLMHPGFGVAAGLALRPEFSRSRLAPLVEFYAGRTQISGRQGRKAAWSIDGALGLRLTVAPRVSLEVRAERHRFLGLPTDAGLSHRAWAGSLGLSAAW